MRFILLNFLFATLLLAQNPTPFSALGDTIYNSVTKIASLKTIDDYSIYKEKIDTYVKDVKKAKEDGFALENGKKGITSQQYLNELRALSKTYGFFLHTVKSNYDYALKHEKSKLFSKIINSGFIDTKEHKKEIMEYYFAHADDMNTTGVIQSYLDADAKLRAKNKKRKIHHKSKKQLEAERIKFIREHDDMKQKEMEKKLQEELKKKKEEIREYQKKELSKTI